MRVANVVERELLGVTALPSFESCPGSFALPAERSFEIGGSVRRVEMLADDHTERGGQSHFAAAREGSSLSPQLGVETDADRLGRPLHVVKITTLLVPGQVRRPALSPRLPAP